jgi:hypothetical protein
VLLLYINRDQWFFGDEWDFLADRSITIGREGLFEPHNEHWSTTPMLIYGLLFRLVGLTSYAPYVAVLVAAHLAVVHLVWRVMLRGRVEPWIATVVCAAYIPFGPGSDNLLWAFQIGFVGSVALGLAAILLADHAGGFGRRDAIGWVVSVLGLTFSGIAVPLVAASAVVAWMRRGFRAFLVTASVPAAVYLVWLATAGSEGLSKHPQTGLFPLSNSVATAESLPALPQFVGRGLAATLSLGTPTFLVGLALLGLTAAAIGLRWRRGGPFPHAVVGAAAGEVLLLLILAVGRAPLGLEAADATRYVHIGVALLLPLLVIGISDLIGRRVLGVLLIAAVAVPWAVTNGSLLLHRANLQAERERLIREQIVAAGTMFDPSSVIRRRPDPVYTPDLHLGELELLLPRFPSGIVPTREAVMRAALALHFSVTWVPEFDTAVPLSDVRGVEATLIPGPNGCADARPDSPRARLLIPLGPPSSVGLTPTSLVELELLLSAGGIRPDYTGSFELAEGRTLYMNNVIDEGLVGEGDIVVRFQGTLLVCAVDAAAAEP